MSFWHGSHGGAGKSAATLYGGHTHNASDALSELYRSIILYMTNSEQAALHKLYFAAHQIAWMQL